MKMKYLINFNVTHRMSTNWIPFDPNTPPMQLQFIHSNYEFEVDEMKKNKKKEKTQIKSIDVG